MPWHAGAGRALPWPVTGNQLAQGVAITSARLSVCPCRQSVRLSACRTPCVRIQKVIRKERCHRKFVDIFADGLQHLTKSGAIANF